MELRSLQPLRSLDTSHPYFGSTSLPYHPAHSVPCRLEPPEVDLDGPYAPHVLGSRHHERIELHPD